MRIMAAISGVIDTMVAVTTGQLPITTGFMGSLVSFLRWAAEKLEV